MADRKTALMWTIAWWFARRYMRRRAAIALAGVTTAAAARRSRVLTGVGVVALVGLLAAAFVAWRKLFAQADAEGEGAAAEVAAAPARTDGLVASPAAADPAP